MNTPNCTPSNALAAGAQRKTACWRRAAAGLASVALALALLLLGSSTSVSAEEPPGAPPPVDVVVLIDSSRSMDKASDKENQKSIQFTQLLIRLLANFAPDSRVAIATFTREPKQIMALTPINEIILGSASSTESWLRQFKSLCAENEPVTDEEQSADPCFGTDYVAALEWAQEQLKECLTDQNSQRACHVFVFTDMVLGSDEEGADAVGRAISSAEEVEQFLVESKSSKLNIHVIPFPLPPHSSDEAVITWKRWEENDLIADFFEGDEQEAGQGKYELLLGMLNRQDLPRIPLAEAGATKTVLLVPASPPNIGTASVRLLVDTGTFTWTFSTEPSFSQNLTFFWNEAALSLPLEMTVTALSEPVTIYYDVSTGTRPLDVSIAAIPPLTPGEQFTVTAKLDIGRDLAGPDMEVVTARITGQDKATELIYAGDNRWSRVLTAPEEAGTYTLTVAALPSNWGEPAARGTSISVEQAVRSIQFDTLPPAVEQGEPVIWQAQFFENGRAVALPDNAKVSVRLEPSSAEVEMVRDAAPDGEWSATTTITQTGWITAYLGVADAAEWSSVPVDPIPLQVNEPPAIQLDVDVASAAPGSQIPVTVSVPAGSDLVPVLHVQGGGIPYTETLMVAGEGRYTASVPMPASGSLVLWATGGEGSAFTGVQTEPEVVEQVAPPIEPTIVSTSAPPSSATDVPTVDKPPARPAIDNNDWGWIIAVIALALALGLSLLNRNRGDKATGGAKQVPDAQKGGAEVIVTGAPTTELEKRISLRYPSVLESLGDSSMLPQPVIIQLAESIEPTVKRRLEDVARGLSYYSSRD